jgi:hypothetical protein
MLVEDRLGRLVSNPEDALPPPFAKHMQMRELMFRMARSGDYANCQSIESDIEALGYRWARQITQNETERAEIDRLCAVARTDRLVKARAAEEAA